MLEGLGRLSTEIVEPFTPLGGAYSGPGHGHERAIMGTKNMGMHHHPTD